MAAELHAFIPGSGFPARAEWQDAIDNLRLPVELDPDLVLPTTTGFRPCKLEGVDSGFELHVSEPRELLATYSSVSEKAPGASIAITFRWGGDLAECACVMAAAAGLVHKWNAVAYYPDDDMFYTLEGLKSDFQSCLAG
jgi:hypothetical protein